jgi:hypothetical protein
MLATDFLLINKELISKLCFGAAPLGGLYGDMNQELADSTVSEALKQGKQTSFLFRQSTLLTLFRY